jgi:hypothetical protein
VCKNNIIWEWYYCFVVLAKLIEHVYPMVIAQNYTQQQQRK